MSKTVALTLATSLLLWSASTSSAMVNCLPPLGAAATGTKETSIEQQQQGLNRVIGAEFSGVTNFGYWDHIGMVGMGSGVYIGNGCVLTSAHVGCYPFRMNDGSHYEPDYSSWRVLKNEDGSKSDLATFRVNVPAESSLSKLGCVPLAESRQEQTPVVLIGTGYTQSRDPLSMKAQGKVIGLLGYRIQPSRSTAWGINRSSQELDAPVATSKDAVTHCFTTRFERSNFAGQAADGDSGGAAFCYNRSAKRWELGGCIIAVSQRQTSVPFGSRTYLGDLSAYVSQLPAAADGVTKKPVITNRSEASATKKSAPIVAHPVAIRTLAR